MSGRMLSIAAGCALALAAGTAAGQGWGGFVKDRLKDKAKDKAGQAVDDAADRTAAEARGAAEGKGEATDDADAARPAPKAAAKPAATGAESPAAQAADEVAAGDVYGNKFDFVPGDAVLLYDDFSETDVGDYPARWTVKDGGGNATEVVSYKGVKWWKSTRGEDGNDWSMHWLRYDPKGDLPKKFTIELDADMGGEFSIVFNAPRGFGGKEIVFDKETIRSENVNTTVKPFGPVVRRVSISVNGTYAKVYVGGARVLQDPDAVERPINRIGFRFDQMGKWDDALLDHQMISSFRLAAGGKDVAQALSAEGRIVVRGIYFATGSDVLEPESGGALRAILQLLQADPGLRFRIEGHTDDQGGPKVNLPLSERRAAAVKAWLVRQGVDEKRLETQGLGATRPTDSNATQEGRANNRRVEFVKLVASASAR